MILTRLNTILAFPSVWRLFRKIIDVWGGIYAKRMAVLRQFGVTPQTSVVDIACGTGQFSRITQAAYLGIDQDSRYIACAQRQFGNGNKKFICADANQAPIADASYEAAILIDATHHLADEENLALFKTLQRAASKMIVICDPVRQSRGNWIGRLLMAFDRGSYIRSEKDLMTLIQKQLEIQEVIKTRLMKVEGICVLARPKIL